MKMSKDIDSKNFMDITTASIPKVDTSKFHEVKIMFLAWPMLSSSQANKYRRLNDSFWAPIEVKKLDSCSKIFINLMAATPFWRASSYLPSTSSLLSAPQI
jgi:hypothetical protein